MTPFTSVTGPAAPLMLNNVDTDVIIRIERLSEAFKNSLDRYAFEALRYNADDTDNADFVLNQPAFRGAPILLADLNFGCGSSREGAVWALQAIGVRCVIAVSFGDIFYGNCFQNGVLPIRLPQDQVATLARLAETGQAFTVDLKECVIKAPDGSRFSFPIQSLLREALLEGLDQIGLTLKQTDAIDSWEQHEAEVRPWNCMVLS